MPGGLGPRRGCEAASACGRHVDDAGDTAATAPGAKREASQTFRLGVKGSGRRMVRGKADRMRLRICTQEVGTWLTSSKWNSHRNSGRSCSSTSSTRSVPCRNTHPCECLLAKSWHLVGHDKAAQNVQHVAQHCCDRP